MLDQLIDLASECAMSIKDPLGGPVLPVVKMMAASFSSDLAIIAD